MGQDLIVTESGAAPRLHCDGLSVTFGNLCAVRDVDLVVEAGEMVGLIGANGAGKTTVIDAIAGFVDHAGSVQVGASEISSFPPYRRARAGVARTFQDARLFGDLSVADNCRVAAERSGGDERTPAPAPEEDVVGEPQTAASWDSAGASWPDRALDLVGLEGFGELSPRELTGGQRSLLGVARALAAAPNLLLLDEPAAGLDSDETERLGLTLRRIVDSSAVGAILVEHDVSLVFDICDRIYVMDAGMVVSSGSPDEVAADPAVMKAYLGLTVGP